MNEPWPQRQPGPGLEQVLSSAFSVVGLSGVENSLQLPVRRRVIVALIDGLGTSILKRFKAHAPFLTSMSEKRRTLSSAFPSTTAASLASLGTGQESGAHGIVGYDVLAPEAPGGPRVINQLGGWPEDISPEAWQPHPTLFERAEEAGVSACTVSQRRFLGSALTRAALRGGEFVVAQSSDERIRAAGAQAASMKRGVVYAYWNELDKAGHHAGVESDQYVRALEDVDFAMKRLYAQLPQDTLLLITADHGMVDVLERDRIDFSQEEELIEDLYATAGEPRMLHLYLNDPSVSGGGNAAGAEKLQNKIERVRRAWSDYLGHRAWIGTRDEVISSGWFGPTEARVEPRIGDLLVAAKTPIALFDGRRVSASALQVVGQHGSITSQERNIPLFVL